MKGELLVTQSSARVGGSSAQWRLNSSQNSPCSPLKLQDRSSYDENVICENHFQLNFALEESTYFQESLEKLVSVLENCVFKEFVYHVVYPQNLPIDSNGVRC